MSIRRPPLSRTVPLLRRTLFGIGLASFLGQRLGPDIEILSGLDAGERVIVPRRGDAASTRPAETIPRLLENPVVLIETTMGTIKAELWADQAPVTVRNFLRYVDEQFYDGLIFHRVKPGFMIQGGGFDVNMQQQGPYEPIKNEADALRSNRRGTLAMARTNVVNSATSQFFINHIDNPFLDHKNTSAEGFGYCVFGEVIEGMDVVDRIAAGKTGRVAGMDDVPLETVEIKSIGRAE